MIFLYRLHHGQAMERLAQIDFAALIADDGGAQHFARDFGEQLLGEIHQVFVIPIGLVEFDHGELGVVARRNPFVAEVAVDLEHLLEAAHHQTLQVQLRCNAQIHFHVQRVVMCLERLG